jgi:GntR family transcriptional regulator
MAGGKPCYHRNALIKINSSTGLPVYLQIIEQVKYLIETGVLRSGDALPSVRNLATHLLISPNTVIKAYTELEHQGVIDLRMGSGAFVRWIPTEKPEKIRMASMSIHETVTQLKRNGFTPEEIRRMFEAELNAPEIAAAAAASASRGD